MIQHGGDFNLKGDSAQIIQNLYDIERDVIKPTNAAGSAVNFSPRHNEHTIEDTEEFIEESLSLEDNEIELIEKALEKNGGKRKLAAQELGISERTLYRKIKEYAING
jgi:transcriptional regulator with PAS, ATPase and Fis domain